MSASGAIGILATLDTKGLEASFVACALEERGLATRIIDLGIKGRPEAAPDISREEVARAVASTPAELMAGPRATAMQRMGEGAGEVLRRMHDAGELGGVIGIGGNQGTAVACLAMQRLPLGLPKVMVSTVASGDVRPFVGAKDITMFFAVADLLGGPNPVTSHVLSQAAAAVAGMALWGKPLGLKGRAAVAITALGNTHPAVSRCLDALRALGHEVVPFHASGACGSAMEELIDLGYVGAVLDLTPHELIGDVLGHDIYRPVNPGRLMAAANRGIPMVVCPGGLDYYCFGPKESIPAHLRHRNTYMHNPNNANVMLSAEEFRVVAKELAARLSRSEGPVALIVPLQGWSQYGRPGGPLYNAAGHEAFDREIRRHLAPTIKVIKVDANINDPIVADTCVEQLTGMLAQTHASAPVG